MKLQVAFTSLFAASASAHRGHMHGGHHMGNGPHSHGSLRLGDHEGLKPLRAEEVVRAQSSHQDTHPTRPFTHVAYHHVEGACAKDVEVLCSERQTPPSFGDPFMDWMLLPSVASPFDEFDDVSAVMDQVIHSFLASPSSFTVTIYSTDFGGQSPKQESTVVDDINFVADSTAAKLAKEKPVEELPMLAEKLQAYGQELIERSEEGAAEHHLGRRLTEMSVDKLHQHVRLPFGCQKNRCLMQALEQGRVSQECAHAIQELNTINQLEREIEHRQETAMQFISVYFALLVAALIVVGKKARQNKHRRQLGNKILQAVYSSPLIKSQVEEELGESVGHTPPVPPFALGMMGANGRRLRKKMKCMRRMHKISLIALIATLLLAPAFVLPICVAIMFVRVVTLCVFSNKMNATECKCCCCGVTTTQASLGAVTEQQACCSCCKGTGVCSPSCKDCCGPSNACCGGKGCESEMLEGCKCCCCGATAAMVKAGELTDEQKCCNCCKGTGACSASCAKCCGNGCCCPKTVSVGKGKKHVFKPKEGIYEGVPVQIV